MGHARISEELSSVSDTVARWGGYRVLGSCLKLPGSTVWPFPDASPCAQSAQAAQPPPSLHQGPSVAVISPFLVKCDAPVLWHKRRDKGRPFSDFAFSVCAASASGPRPPRLRPNPASSLSLKLLVCFGRGCPAAPCQGLLGAGRHTASGVEASPESVPLPALPRGPSHPLDPAACGAGSSPSGGRPGAPVCHPLVPASWAGAPWPGCRTQFPRSGTGSFLSGHDLGHTAGLGPEPQ